MISWHPKQPAESGVFPNAASVASMILTTEALVADKPEPPAPAAAPNPGMGGGMY